ncbi:MAG: hypothetical protein QWI73_07215, partial [Alphaproteobacteria bacterium]|nr:hypothetical protein [Alphaproteobacteria bacterium]MDN5249855.1 hypothetical protein [Alphaproteobacteria bacterium]
MVVMVINLGGGFNGNQIDLLLLLLLLQSCRFIFVHFTYYYLVVALFSFQTFSLGLVCQSGGGRKFLLRKKP